MGHQLLHFVILRAEGGIKAGEWEKYVSLEGQLLLPWKSYL
jgi:hypothetical protein